MDDDFAVKLMARVLGVGRSLSERMTADIVISALTSAESCVYVAGNAIFHADRGAQHASRLLAEWARDNDVRLSCSRSGDCRDNAVAESFFATLKNTARPKKTADEPFFVLLGDVIVPDNNICPRMLEVSRAHDGASVIAVLPVPDEQVHRFGIIDGAPVEGEDGVWKVNSLVEKPALEDAPSNLSVFGRYLLSARVMELLADAKPTVGGEIQLTDALDAVLAEEEMYAVVISDEDGFDTGTVETWLDTNNKLYARKNG